MKSTLLAGVTATTVLPAASAAKNVTYNDGNFPLPTPSSNRKFSIAGPKTGTWSAAFEFYRLLPDGLGWETIPITGCSGVIDQTTPNWSIDTISASLFHGCKVTVTGDPSATDADGRAGVWAWAEA